MNQDALIAMVREVLGESHIALAMHRYTLTEDLDAGRAAIGCELTRLRGGVATAESPQSVHGEGVGMIDALFKALTGALADEFPSLNHIHFVDFTVSGDFSGATRAKSDALGHVGLAVENSSGRRFDFSHASASISASSAAVVLEAIAHFVNAELAVLRVFDWIDDARKRNRHQLVEAYTHRLADLLHNASYSETIERRKAQD